MQGEITFCGFSMGRNQYWAGRVYDLCVYYMTGTPEGSTKSGFMEKPGIEPATPGLQGIALIHYTRGASLEILLSIIKIPQRVMKFTDANFKIKALSKIANGDK